MFSSLPSASKIYQSSVKSRQKSASSAKRRRKKAHSSVNHHVSILDDSVVSLVSCDHESAESVTNGQKDLFDQNCRHSYERENSSPEISLHSVETYETNSKNYNSIPEQDNHARSLCEIDDKKDKNISFDMCIKQNEMVSKQINKNDHSNLLMSNTLENSKLSYSDLMADKLHKESEAELSSKAITADSDNHNLSCNEYSNEKIKSDLIGMKDISEMTFEEVEASIEQDFSKELFDKAMQMNEAAERDIIYSEDSESNASLLSVKTQCSGNKNIPNVESVCNPDIPNAESVCNPEAPNVEIMCNLNIPNVESVCNPDISNVDIANTVQYDNGSQMENATHSSHFDICHVKSSNDVTSLSHEEIVDSATVASSEPHMDVMLVDKNGNCLPDSNDHSEENIACWTNPDSCNSNEQNIEVSVMKENVKVDTEFPLRNESPEPSELSCTESMLCETKEYYREILLPDKTFSNSNEKSEDFLLSSEKQKEDFPMKSSNISQSFSNLLSKDSQTVVSSRCSSVPEDLHLSRKFADKHSQSAVLTVLDKATLTVDLESSEECLSERYSSNEESHNENCEQELAENSAPGSKEKSSLWNVLPPLAMVKARSRSYVFGSKGPTGSLLGSDELNRFFPDNQLTVFVGTWNMNGHDPPQSIDDFLLPLAINTLPDIYAIGVQESMQSRLEWEVLLQTTLGPSHVLFTSASLGVLHLCIFLRRDLIWFCSEPEEASVATRPGTMVKTKGAVAVCFMCFGTSFLFVNSHLTAHEQKLKERLSDYEKIISSLELPKSLPVRNHSRDKDVTSRFDCVLWCGDLNFRVMHDRPSVLSFVEEKVRSARPSCSFLVKRDQLHKAMEEGRAFHGFKESVIHFIPSYKFDVGTSTFNSSKLRVPSYTDRILYRSRENSSVSCLHYNAVPEISTSDHKPVYAVFKVTLKPGRDNVPLAAGMFKRDVYLEAIKRRSNFLEVRHNLGQSTICSIM